MIEILSGPGINSNNELNFLAFLLRLRTSGSSSSTISALNLNESTGAENTCSTLSLYVTFPLIYKSSPERIICSTISGVSSDANKRFLKL